MEMNQTKLMGYGIVALMVFSLAAMLIWGIGANERLIPVALFSVSMSIAVIFFDEWFKKEG